MSPLHSNHINNFFISFIWILSQQNNINGIYPIFEICFYKFLLEILRYLHEVISLVLTIFHTSLEQYFPRKRHQDNSAMRNATLENNLPINSCPWVILTSEQTGPSSSIPTCRAQTRNCGWFITPIVLHYRENCPARVSITQTEQFRLTASNFLELTNASKANRVSSR